MVTAMKRMLHKKVIRREVSLVHFLLLTTSKILIGVGIGIAFATRVYYVQPYWYLIILAGVMVMAPILYDLMKAETKEELKLKRKLK